MDTRNVNSSAVSRVGYDDETNVLVVQFTQGKLYYYWPVEKGVFYDLIDAESKGRFVQNEIVQNSQWVKDLLVNRDKLESPRNKNIHYIFKKGRDVSSYEELKEYLV